MCCRLALGPRTPFWSRTLSALVLLSLSLVVVSAAPAQDIVQVEEDWELVVGEPDPDSQSPQITCVTSPVGHADGVYAAFDVNHQSLSEYSDGGMQLQLWQDDAPITTGGFPSHNLMLTSGERVTWTLRMRIHGGQLIYEVVNGSSTTWGSFGGQGYLRVEVPTTLTNLNGYSPLVSVANSGVGFAGNRVQKLGITRVRVKNSLGLVVEDATEHLVGQE